MSALAVAHSAAFSRWEADQDRAAAMEREADELLAILRSGGIEHAAEELHTALEGQPSLVLDLCRIAIKADRGLFPKADTQRLFMDCAHEHGKECGRAFA